MDLLFVWKVISEFWRNLLLSSWQKKSPLIKYQRKFQHNLSQEKSNVQINYYSTKFQKSLCLNATSALEIAISDSDDELSPATQRKLCLCASQNPKQTQEAGQRTRLDSQNHSFPYHTHQITEDYTVSSEVQLEWSFQKNRFNFRSSELASPEKWWPVTTRKPARSSLWRFSETVRKLDAKLTFTIWPSIAFTRDEFESNLLFQRTRKCGLNHRHLREHVPRREVSADGLRIHGGRRSTDSVRESEQQAVYGRK